MSGWEGWPKEWRARMQRPRSGEWVTFAGLPMTRPEPDPLQAAVDDLVRMFDPGGYSLQCPVAGCGAHWYVPRMELDPEPLDAGTGDWVVHAEAVPREDVELILRTHADWHAVLCETDARDAPLPQRPDLDHISEPEGWRIP